jgi:ribonuclease P protein component
MSQAMQRLKTRAQFQAVLNSSVIAKTEHFVLHRRVWSAPTDAPATGDLPKTDADTPVELFTDGVWIGAMAPKRCAKRAVTRNAVKRQIYALAWLHMTGWCSAAFLVRLRKEFSKKLFPSASSACLVQAIRAELTTLMQLASAKSIA